jgi:beta-glucosidase
MESGRIKLNMPKSKFLIGLFFIVLFSSVSCSTLFAQANKNIPANKNDNTSLEKKARDLVTQMTLEEKIGITVGDGKFLPAAGPKATETGTGIIIHDQKSKPLIPRLSIYSTPMADGPAGLNRHPRKKGQKEYNYTTAFPTAPCLASTWNTGLVERVGRAFGNEALELGIDLVLAPGINIHRNPKCGRAFEYYSEDPLLTGKMVSSMVKGLQSNGVGATLKCLVAYNQETNRRHYNGVIGQRALREIYLRASEIAVKESKPQSIMTSYSKVNGYFTAENPELLQTIVRQNWGFDGFYITDFDGSGSAVAKVRAGNNLLMSGSEQEYNELANALKNKELDKSVLDENLYHYIKFKLNSPRTRGYISTFKPDLKSHAKIAREAASEGMVLLKNDDKTLPISNKKRVALFGKIGYHLIPFGTGSGSVRSYKYAVSVNEGLQAAGFKVVQEMETAYVELVEKIKKENLVPPYFDTPKHRKDNGIVDDQAPPHFKERLVAFSKEPAISVADILKYESQSDVAVITFGRSAGENYENGYLPITQVELDLLKNVSAVFHAKGKRVIVVLNVGGVWETASWRDYADAVLLAWQPGQEGGHAVADIFKGVVNPSGKLPDSFPMKYEDVPSASTFPGEPVEAPINSLYNDGIYVGYRYYDSFNVPTAYEFGYGMSYTSFDYSDLKLSGTNFSSKLKVTVTVKNSGKVAGKEVAQLYLAAPSTKIEKPVQELKGFAKTKLLKPGERQTLSFELDERSLASFWSGMDAWVADEGDYEVRIGASYKDIRLKASFNLSEDIIVEKVHDVLYPNFVLKEMSRFSE